MTNVILDKIAIMNQVGSSLGHDKSLGQDVMVLINVDDITHESINSTIMLLNMIDVSL
jgi:hypothetical protein